MSREPPSASVSNAEGMAKHFSNDAVTPVVPKLFGVHVITINYYENRCMGSVTLFENVVNGREYVGRGLET
eukprot:2771836-Prymnesium_polylepis.1